MRGILTLTSPFQHFFPWPKRRRLQLETMGRVLTRVGSKIVIDKDAKGVLPLLSLDALKAGVK